MQNQLFFLLSYIKYGENDAILHCFSQESGFQSLFVRGIYAPKNKKKAYLFPLNQINVTINQKNKFSAMPVAGKIEKGELTIDYYDVKIYTIVFFISDFLHQILREETHFHRIFIEIGTFLEELNLQNINAYIAFIFNILKAQGISPLIDDEKYLDPETGNFSAVQNHVIFDEEISQIWKNYLSAANNCYQIKLKRSLRSKTLESLMYYYKIHFAGFYMPNSLEVIEQIFE